MIKDVDASILHIKQTPTQFSPLPLGSDWWELLLNSHAHQINKRILVSHT